MPQFKVKTSLTVYCAVSNCHYGPQFMTGHSTCAELFVYFINQLKERRCDTADTSSPMFLVLDGKLFLGCPKFSRRHLFSLRHLLTYILGHSAHTAIVHGVEATITSAPWKVFFNPKGSSWYNAAETLISVTKAQISKSFALKEQDITTKQEFTDLVEEELEKVSDKYTPSRLIHSIVPELQQEITRYQKRYLNR